ncbi:MAG: HAD family hydrolase [Candidatus Aenigmarchaeota archaeon]|nr:HAD family hydrolase [Candidatus Aenigmarchaeota archaeon]
MRNVDGNTVNFYKKIGLSEEESKKVAHLFKKYYMNVAGELKLFPKTDKVIKSIKGRGLKVAIVSNTYEHFIRFFLKKFGLLEYIDIIIGGDEKARLKPDPYMLELVMKRLSVRPEERIHLSSVCFALATYCNINYHIFNSSLQHNNQI